MNGQWTISGNSVTGQSLGPDKTRRVRYKRHPGFRGPASPSHLRQERATSSGASNRRAGAWSGSNTAIVGGNPCHAVYFPGSNTVALVKHHRYRDRRPRAARKRADDKSRDILRQGVPVLFPGTM